jgi:hypothetical protein
LDRANHGRSLDVPGHLRLVAWRHDLEIEVDERQTAAETDGGTQMAHVGTQMDLSTQPAKAASSTQAGPWGALLAAILIVAIAVGLVMATVFVAGSKPASGTSAAEQSYTQVENLRGAAILPGATVDRSYDKIEDLRGGAFLGTSGADELHGARNNR